MKFDFWAEVNKGVGNGPFERDPAFMFFISLFIFSILFFFLEKKCLLFFFLFFKYVSLLALVPVFNFRYFHPSRCSMEMWCPDDTRRNSWGWVGSPAWVRARFNSPEWRLLACLKRSLPDCIIVAVVDAVACAVAKRNNRQEVPIVKMIFLCENSFFWAVDEEVRIGPFEGDSRFHFFIFSFKCFSLPASVSEFNCRCFQRNIQDLMKSDLEKYL